MGMGKSSCNEVDAFQIKSIWSKSGEGVAKALFKSFSHHCFPCGSRGTWKQKNSCTKKPGEEKKDAEASEWLQWQICVALFVSCLLNIIVGRGACMDWSYYKLTARMPTRQPCWFIGDLPMLESLWPLVALSLVSKCMHGTKQNLQWQTELLWILRNRFEWHEANSWTRNLISVHKGQNVFTMTSLTTCCWRCTKSRGNYADNESWSTFCCSQLSSGPVEWFVFSVGAQHWTKKNPSVTK